ncbi:MAG: hypothetical protein H7X77_06630 [Anaerolineae bacterium]|nr:hypothetical protein [Anaerolineae bacterium]
MLSFSVKLAQIQQQKQNRLGLWLAPRLEQLPLSIQRFDEPLLPYGKAVINASRDRVCAYIFDLASYLRLGAAGAIALERTIDFAGGDHITILHGGFALPDLAVVSDENAFGVDALTVVNEECVDACLMRLDRGVFRLGTPVPDLRENVGHYDYDERRFEVNTALQGETLSIHCLAEAILQDNRGDDFAEVIRSQLEQIQNGG